MNNFWNMIRKRLIQRMNVNVDRISKLLTWLGFACFAACVHVDAGSCFEKDKTKAGVHSTKV